MKILGLTTVCFVNGLERIWREGCCGQDVVVSDRSMHVQSFPIYHIMCVLVQYPIHFTLMRKLHEITAKGQKVVNSSLTPIKIVRNSRTYLQTTQLALGIICNKLGAGAANISVHWHGTALSTVQMVLSFEGIVLCCGVSCKPVNSGNTHFLKLWQFVFVLYEEKLPVIVGIRSRATLCVTLSKFSARLQQAPSFFLQKFFTK